MPVQVCQIYSSLYFSLLEVVVTMVSEDRMRAVFDPEDFTVGEPLVMFFVGNSIVNRGDVYAAVRECWQMADPDKRRPAFNLVLARSNDRILGAFRPGRWTPCTRDDGNKGWGFVGEHAEPSIQEHYVGKRVPDRFRTQNPVRYLNPGD